jgi:predicted TPR repeat methyltransferase
LQYRVPQLLGEVVGALAARRGAPYAHALDAGCGTGLAAG